MSDEAAPTGIMKQDGDDGGRGRKRSTATFHPAATDNHQPQGSPAATGARRSSRRISASGWKRRMSFAALGEVLPSLDLYRLGGGRKKRPSIGELHGDNSVSCHPVRLAPPALPCRHVAE